MDGGKGGGKYPISSLSLHPHCKRDISIATFKGTEQLWLLLLLLVLKRANSVESGIFW